MLAAEIRLALAFSRISCRYVNDVVLAHGERKLLQDGDTLSFGGARLLRQAHRDYDEPNPFNFKLTDMHRLFESGLPHAVPDAPSPPRREQPSAVIDLTVSRTQEQMRRKQSLGDLLGPSLTP